MWRPSCLVADSAPDTDCCLSQRAVLSLTGKWLVNIIGCPSDLITNVLSRATSLEKKEGKRET